ncbi:MAG: efflux RND transporter periplasmic adaptor subunit [Acidobacteria bacterium]|nr:efflux RND transporter periplasmic adaptor subunit [Acidobacteriota bacterium]MBI3657355.1 efflux RND transporter periplasmic adaptor subunit [Acidobacteriota bacterium]
MSRKKKILIGVIVGVLVIGIVTASLNYNRTEKTTVQTGRVERKELLESRVNASGEIRAKETVDIQAEVPGIIVELNVREGDRVKQGDVLLRLDPIQSRSEAEAAAANVNAFLAETSQQQMQIANAENNHERDKAGLLTAKADLEQARVQHLRAKGTHDRKMQLYEENLLSREEYELARADWNATQSVLAAAQARVNQAEIQIKTSALQIEQMRAMTRAVQSRLNGAKASQARALDVYRKTTIYSPLTGIITKLNVEKGERAIPGIQSDPRATLMTIADMSVVQVDLKVDETDVVGISLGDKAKVKVDALPEKAIEAEVIEIGNSPMNKSSTSLTNTQEAKDFKVRIQLKEPPTELRPGLSATADITTKVKNNVITAPLQAITVRELPIDAQGNHIPPDPAALKKKNERKGFSFFGGSSPKGVTSASKDKDKKIKKKEFEGVFAINKDNSAQFRPVKTGIKGETEIEMLKGLSEGEEIITGSYKTLRTIEDGTPVKIDNTANKGDQDKKEK